MKQLAVDLGPAIRLPCGVCRARTVQNVAHARWRNKGHSHLFFLASGFYSGCALSGLRSARPAVVHLLRRPPLWLLAGSPTSLERRGRLAVGSELFTEFPIGAAQLGVSPSDDRPRFVYCLHRFFVTVRQNP